MPISYRFREKRRFVENQNFFRRSIFPTPRVFNSPAEGVSWNFATAVALKKVPTRWWKEFDDICIRFDTIPEYDGQTDGFAVAISRSACIGMLTRDFPQGK